jgi:hypothetical protein
MGAFLADLVDEARQDAGAEVGFCPQQREPFADLFGVNLWVIEKGVDLLAYLLRDIARQRRPD